MNKNKAFFLDRDGVLIKDIPYLKDAEKVFILDGVADAIRMINSAGYKCIVVSNQSGVARGLISIEEVGRIHQKIRKLLSKKNATVDDFFFCPHHPQGVIEEFSIRCQCRKPGIKLITDAAKRYNIDLTQSIMVGDKYSDYLAGKNAGCCSIVLHVPQKTRDKMMTFVSLYDVVNTFLT